jgi:lysophospholipase L1-like esterase
MNNLLLKIAFSIYLFFIILCLGYPIYISGLNLTSFFLSLTITALYLLVTDLGFRAAYRFHLKRPYQMVPKVPFSKIIVEPHPYMPYVNKAGVTNPKRQQAHYLLNPGKYWVPQLRTNNYRYCNGPAGDRDIAIPKPPGLIRINCFGASTTGNYLESENVIYSYPLELERTLRQKFFGLNIEVNNCGVGGRTTAEILIDFLLSAIDTSPDIIVLYHAYNDLQPSLTPGFSSDYSHAKRNLGETYHLYHRYSKIPALPLSLYNMFVNKLFLSNVIYSLLQAISKGEVDLNLDFQGLATYERNIEHLINICKTNNIYVVCSTFCYYLYDDVKDSVRHLKYYSGVIEENAVMTDLCHKHDIPLIDNFNLIPREEKYFMDTIHFTPEGMTLVAENISKPIIEYLAGQVNQDKE